MTKPILNQLLRLAVSIVAVPILVGLPPDALAQEAAAQKNSMKKNRVVPNSQSQRIGSAVNWEPDFDSAIAKSKTTGKPIFWYVPTLDGSFMDRKPEINRYMLAGPFSWPDIVDVINEHYIPVKTEPTGQQQQRYELLPYKFIEPGFLVVDPLGTAKSKVDRITTLHPTWFRHLLTRDVLQPIQPSQKPAPLVRAWQLFQANDFAATLATLKAGTADLQSASQAHQCESELLAGMAAFRTGQHEQAKNIWSAASERFPDQPLAWKAAAESQRIGPFVRGFEVHGPISEVALNAGIGSEGSAAPPGSYSESKLWENGTQFLLGMQNVNGGFTDSDYDFGGTDSLPNVHVAVTSLAGMALLKAAEQKDLPRQARAKLIDAIIKALSFVTDDANLNKFDRDEILWAYAYRLRFLSRCLNQKNIKLPIDQAELEAAIAIAAKNLEGVQSRKGNWYHEYNNPFVTATALSALYEAQQSGAPVDQTKIQKGLAALSADRFANGSYPYNSSGRQNRDKAGTPKDVAAAAGRMPICEMGLWYWNQSSDEALVSAIQRSLAMHENLDVALKYDDHTSTLGYGGFFFWYDMRGRSEAIAQVKDQATQAKFKARQKEIIMALPELDGCFVDSHELGRVYGTAMALLSLANCE